MSNSSQPSFFFTSSSQQNSPLNSNNNSSAPNFLYNDQNQYSRAISPSPASTSSSPPPPLPPPSQAHPPNLAETGRRYSNGFSRMAFSIYGNQVSAGSPNRSSYSSTNSMNYNTMPMRLSHSVHQISPPSNSQTETLSRKPINTGAVSAANLTQFTPSINTAYAFEQDRVVYNTQGEVLACAKSHETPNLLATATAKNLQLLKVSSNDIALEQELSMRLTGSRSSKFGIISDLSFGHQLFGRHLAAGTINGSIHVFHLDRGTRVKNTLSDHQRAVNTLDFNSINGHTMLSGSQDGRIKIWDLRTRNTRASITLNGNADAVRGAQFNTKKANILAAVFDSGVIEKWDIRKPNTWERRINAHTGPALAIDWHPELEYIVTGGRDKQVQVWNLTYGHESREPSHVIFTTGPILKAKWCKGSGNRSINNTEIATCYLNDDPCINIWNLNRKYIPKNIIECHSGQITQLLWRTPKHLISGSKDKTLVQHDVSKSCFTVDNMNGSSFEWNPANNCDFSFVKQEKGQFDRSTFEFKRMNSTAESVFSDSQSIYNTPMSLNTSSINNSNGNKSPRLNSVASSASFSSIQQQRRPHLPHSNSKSFIHPDPALIFPVHIPTDGNDTEKFEFLSSNYLFEIPNGTNIINVCEFNATVALEIGDEKEYQTWQTIKAAVAIDLKEKKNVTNIHTEMHQSAVQTEHEDNESNFGKSEYKSRLGTSFGSEMSCTSNSLDPIEQKTMDTINIDHSTTVNIEQQENTAIDDTSIKSDSADTKLEGSTAPLPINIKNTNKAIHRYSFTGSSVDFDDEKSETPLSLSASPFLNRSKSRLFSEARDVIMPLISKSVETRNSKSYLTEIIQNSSSVPSRNSKKNDPANIEEIVVPWNPTDMIREILDYEVNEGNVLLCAAIALLFKSLYPESFSSEHAEEWVSIYRDLLSRKTSFTNAAYILKLGAKKYSSLKVLGQTQTSVRTICANCKAPVLNEKSKDRLKNGDEGISFGFWYCDKCGKRQGNCVYCWEPIRGNAVGLLKCGHLGHFGCFRNWFIEESENECPGC